MRYDRDPGESSRSITRGPSSIAAQSVSLTNMTKYGGLIKLSLFKRFRNSLILTMMHIDQIAPTLQFMHSFIAFFRFLQFLAPAFLCCDSIIFEKGSAPYSTVFFLSILYRLLPFDMASKIVSTMLFIYSGISIIFYTLFATVSIYYLKTAKITDQISNLLNVIIFTFGYLAQPIAGSLIGESVMNLILKPENSTFTISAIVLSVLCLVVHVYLNVYIFAHSIIFRPDSIHFVHGENNLLFMLFTFLINIVIGAAIHAPYIPKLVLLGVAIILYILSYIFVSRGPSFTSQKQEATFMGCCFSGIFCLVAGAIFVVLKMPGEMIFIGICIFVVIVSFLTSYIVTNKIAMHYLFLLDNLADSEGDGLPSISLSRFLKMTVIGFRECHDQCSSFKVFQAGLIAWQDEPRILCLYAKFMAIYPECNHQLAIIQKKLIAIGHNSIAAKMYVHQIGSTINQRENVVTLSLRHKMLGVQKKVNAAKRKLQALWECIIQSNIAEMGKATGLAFTACNNAELDLIKLKREFPNSTFVARGYYRFLLEVRHDVPSILAQQEILRKLRMGQQVVMDRANELGINAFPNLPPVPIRITDRPKADISIESENTIEDDTSFQDLEASMAIQEKIRKLRLPSVTKTIGLIVGVTLVIAIIPIIILISLNNYYVMRVFEPITYMKQISLMRSLNFQLAACLLRISLEEMLPEGKALVTQYPEGYAPSNLNSSRETRVHFLVFIGKVGKTTEEVNKMRDFKKGNEKIEQVKMIIFQSVIPYQFFTNNTHYTNTTMSGVQALMAAALHCGRVATIEFIETLFNMPDFQNPRKNAEAIGDSLNLALSVFDEYVMTHCQTIKNIFLIAQIVASILIVIIYFFIVRYSLQETQKETNEIYRVLVSLPKSAVIKAADAIRVIKRSEIDSDATNDSSMGETSKQEENIVKLFMSANENTNANKLIHTLFVLFALIIVIGILVSINVMCGLYTLQYNSLAFNAPHIDYVMGTSAYMYGCVLNVMTITLTQSFMQFDSDLKVHVSRFETRISKFRDYYNSLRYGGTGSYDNPFSGFNEASADADNMINCTDIDHPPSDLNDAYVCYDAETQFILFAILSRRVFEPYIQKNIDKTFKGELPAAQDLKVENYYVNVLWTLGPIVLYDTFVKPLYDLIDKSITEDMKANVASDDLVSTVMIVLIAISILFIILLVKELEKRAQFFLSLVLHMDMKTVLSSPKIMSILNGNIMGATVESSERGVEFYEEVVDKLMNGTVIVDETGKISYVNSFIKNNFLEEEEDLIGKDISALFNNRFDGDIRSVIDKVNLEKIMLQHNNKYYRVTKVVSKQNNIISVKDETKLMHVMKLIAEENNKCEVMLSSILPRSLVYRVQVKENNISFVVQSSSVLMMNIVNFSHWSSTKTGPYIMKTLNYLYKEIDSAIVEFPLMTKIKVFGDCYLAAGGIFEDVNHPAAHAKQAVEFGLKMIDIIERFNKENNEQIQIRIGLNTDGPITAGILSVGRPVFEIIGKGISVAQQMEQHGVPMAVHITRSTYELVYGGIFNIKERGNLEINGQSIVTYYIRQQSV